MSQSPPEVEVNLQRGMSLKLFTISRFLPKHKLGTNGKRQEIATIFFSNIVFIKFCGRWVFCQFSSVDLGSLMVQDSGVYFVP